MNIILKDIIIWLLLFGGIIFEIYYYKRLPLAKELLNDKAFLSNFVIMVFFIIYIFVFHFNEHNKIKAIKKGFVAFIIALMVHFKLIFAPFWIVFFIVCYLKEWV